MKLLLPALCLSLPLVAGCGQGGNAEATEQASAHPEINESAVELSLLGREVALGEARRWQFERDAPVSASVVDSEYEGDAATVVTRISTQSDCNSAAGNLRLGYEWLGNNWMLTRIEPIDFVPEHEVEPANCGRASAAPASATPAPAAAPSSAGAYNRAAVIDDPDGYTNVRSLASTSGTVVDVIYAGQTLYKHPQWGNWWHVRTPSGKYGYVHSSRIRMR